MNNVKLGRSVYLYKINIGILEKVTVVVSENARSPASKEVNDGRSNSHDSIWKIWLESVKLVTL